jgi:hypothetical protein
MVVLMAVLPASSHAIAATDAESATPSHHVQAGFDSARFSREFERWAYWFDFDWTACRQDDEKEHDRILALLEKHEAPSLQAFFSHSIVASPEGDRMRERLVQDVLLGLQPRSTEAAMGRLVRKELGESLRPVGFGGTIQNAGHSAELWYVSVGDPDDNLQQDKLLAAIFEQPQVPAYGVAERNAWLTMAFVRAPDGSLRLDAETPEMKRFIEVLLAQMGIAPKMD